MKKETTVVMLPTPIKHGSHQKGIIHKYCDELSLTEIMMVTKDAEGCVSTPHHLYITTDDEIKEGDWCHYRGMHIGRFEIGESGNIRKIIATTDPELNLPQIPQSFIEEYCKNPVDKVMVEYNRFDGQVCPLGLSDDDGISYKLKLTSNNEIIIHPIEEKMYSRDEVEAIAAKFLLLGFGKSAEGRNAEILCESRWLEEMFPEHFESIEIFTKDNL